MIEVRNLKKAYGGGALAQTVLHDVDLTVDPGEVLMLVGPSGSGKTTLLSILGCVLTPSSGSVQLAGHELMGVPEGSLPMMRLRYIGFIFQSHNLLPSLTALDNVRLPLLLRGWSGARATGESEVLLESVGLKEKMT